MSGVVPEVGGAQRGGRTAQLIFAGLAVMIAAADTYVVVLALTAMMVDLNIGIDQLQRATPVISGYLTGYVAVLPLLGRLSDLYGREPVLLICLLAFAVGSFLTATASTLVVVVLGRVLQGLGGGGLVPVTIAMVADNWPAERRNVPLGVVSGVQEFGSVIGPVYGAAILALSTWRTIFWINLPVALVVAAGVRLTRPRNTGGERTRRRDPLGALLLCTAALVLGAAVWAPGALTDNAVIGALYATVGGESGPTEMALLGLGLALLAVVWDIAEPLHRRGWLALRGLPRLLHRADWLGALLATLTLGAIVVAFAAGDPSRQVLSGAAPVALPLAGACALAFVFHERHSRTPLVAFGALRAPAAGGGLLGNVFVGAGLMAALADVPIFARTTTFPDSQVGAALVLVRFLAAVPVGAVLGGVALRWVAARVTGAAAMVISAAAFVAMGMWSATTLSDPLLGPIHAGDVALVVCGLGFGLAIAPVNAAVLAAVEHAWHGLASALVVVARTVGMLTGLSVLTAAGLHAFHSVAVTLPLPQDLCPTTPTHCPAYDTLSTNAIVSEMHVIFRGAAIACGLAALVFAVTLRTPREVAA